MVFEPPGLARFGAALTQLPAPLGALRQVVLVDAVLRPHSSSVSRSVCALVRAVGLSKVSVLFQKSWSASISQR